MLVFALTIPSVPALAADGTDAVFTHSVRLSLDKGSINSDAANDLDVLRIFKRTIPADEAIQSVETIGFVDDGAKISAVVLKYSMNLSGAKISKDTYKLTTVSKMAAVFWKSAKMHRLHCVFM